MRRVAGVFPLNVHPTTCVAALTVAAVFVAAALYVGENAAAYLPDKITITSWQPPTLARDLAAPEPSQTSNRAQKAAGEAPRAIEARRAPEIARPKPEIVTPMPEENGGEDGAPAETGRASWYDLDSKTASGEMMDGEALTAAHPTLPLGSQVRVANLDNGRAVVVRINDRGPFAKDRIIDLSKAAAETIGMVEAGVARVSVSLVESEVASNVKASSEAPPLQR